MFLIWGLQNLPKLTENRAKSSRMPLSGEYVPSGGAATLATVDWDWSSSSPELLAAIRRCLPDTRLADDLTLDQEDLADVGEVEVVVEPAGAPDAARLDAPVLCG
jgi:hypothetical protein